MRLLLPLLLTTFYFLHPSPVSAHAFGSLYNLPVPFWMYLYGGAAAIIVSFLIIGYFLSENKSFSYSKIKLMRLPTLPLNILKIINVFLLILLISTGLFGIDSSFLNFNMTYFWVIFILGISYLSVFIGNIYSLINPGKVLVECFEKILGEKIEGIYKYPKWLGYYPALFFYFLFIWIELFGNTTPFKLSIIILQYTIINMIGIILWGKQAWFKYGEFLSIFFGLLGKMAPIELKEGKLYLRAPFIGLLNEKPDHFSLVLFILFMLSSTAFDGFSETIPWVRFYWGTLQTGVTPPWGNYSYEGYQTIGLILSPFVFLLLYIICMGLTKVFTKTSKTLMDLLSQFAFSLIPIAFVYNVAHYFTLLLTEGLNIIRLSSDPFGFGWNLFGTSDYLVNIIPDANFVWHFQVGVIILGHIVGVYLAHIIALNYFKNRQNAILSQLPMLILMVSFTMIGLWILSQPITTGV